MALLLLLTWGCGPGEDDAPANQNPSWTAGQAWSVMPAGRIGKSGEVDFGMIVDVAMDAEGRVWVADASSNDIRVFTRDGELVRTVGRRGGGPAEFTSLGGMDWDLAGRLWVMDGGNARFSVWDTAGNLVATHPRTVDVSTTPWPLGFDRSGRLFDVASVGGAEIDALVAYDSLLKPLDTLRLPPFQEPAAERVSMNGSSRVVSRTVLPFSPSQKWALDRRGYVWVAVTDKYRIERRGPDGRVDGVVRRTVPPVPVNRVQRNAALEQLRTLKRQGAQVDESALPTTLPVLYYFFASEDGHLWVSTAKGDGFGYDVFTPAGLYLGEVRTPERLRPSPAPVIRGDYMAGVATNEDGEETILMLRIVRPGR
ncbi:MAG TPA: 6-bladed beta-propeller [Longimicrobium sp.]